MLCIFFASSNSFCVFPSACQSFWGFTCNVCLCAYVVREWWKAKATLERKAWGKAEGARWPADDKGEVWWHLISLITDTHPRTQNAKQRVQRQGRVGEVDTKLKVCQSMHLCSQSQAILRWFQQPQPETSLCAFVLLILWQSYSSQSLVKFHLWLMATVGVFKQKKKKKNSFLSLEALGESQWGVLHVAVSRST